MMPTSALSRIYRSRIFGSIVIILGLIMFACVGLAAWFVPGFAIRETAGSDNLGVIRVLLACNHRLVSTGDAFGQTPLHYAAANGQTELQRPEIKSALGKPIINLGNPALGKGNNPP